MQCYARWNGKDFGSPQLTASSFSLPFTIKQFIELEVLQGMARILCRRVGAIGFCGNALVVITSTSLFTSGEDRCRV